jgi:type I restriction enzyme S subunit
MERFGAAVTRTDERIPGVDLPLMSVSQTRGVLRRSELTDKVPRADSLDAYKVCRQGDIVFNKMSVGAGAVGVAPEDGLVTYHYEVMRPAPSTEARYIVYLMKSAWFTGEMMARERGIGAGTAGGGVRTTEVPFSVLRTIEAPLPDLDTQRRIADRLDREVARIDEITLLRSEQIQALTGRAGVAFDSLLEACGVARQERLDLDWAESPLPNGWRVARLSQVLRQLTNGFVGPTRDILVDDGIRYIQGTHIKEGAIDFDRRPYFVRPEWHASRPRIHLRAGDVLIVQTGDIGKVAVVPENFGAASCHALQIARVHEGVLTGEYLGAYLASTYGYNSLLSRATGALHPHLEGGIRDVPIVVPPLVAQAEIVVEVTAAREAIRTAREEMRRQVADLQERRKSLVTSAMTAQFDVTQTSDAILVTG